MKVIVLIAPALLALAGCATVQPWEKGKLAKPEMTFGGDKLETRYADHVYTSRELVPEIGRAHV